MSADSSMDAVLEHTTSFSMSHNSDDSSISSGLPPSGCATDEFLGAQSPRQFQSDSDVNTMSPPGSATRRPLHRIFTFPSIRSDRAADSDDSGDGTSRRMLGVHLAASDPSGDYASLERRRDILRTAVRQHQESSNKRHKSAANSLNKTPKDRKKRPLLSEFFALSFELCDGLSDSNDKELINALKGVTLEQAIVKPLERRQLTTNQVDVFLEFSSTALPLSSECYRLANSVLYVRQKVEERGERKPTASKSKKKTLSSSEDSCYNDVSPYSTLTRSAGSPSTYPSVSGSLNTPISTTTPSLSGFESMRYRSAVSSANKTHSKLPALFTSPFAKTQDKQEHLNEILAKYSRHGLPRMPELLTLGRPHIDQSVFHLERHWSDIVSGHSQLTKRQRDQQEAVWELLTTEIEYIRKLRVIIDLFLSCLYNLQNEQLLNEIEVGKVFSNIADVFYATCHFWVSHMCQMLRQARKTRELLDPCLLKAGFLVFDKIFEPYTKYCLEQEVCREYIKTKMAENELFRTFITWAEMQKQCNRLKLVDLIVKPWQRLTKYKLLLHAVRKPLEKNLQEMLTQHSHHVIHSPSSVDEQKADIEAMWAQQHECCRHLRLQDLLSSPWQRLMRYRLLLRSLLRQVDKSASTVSETGAHVKAMIENVERFLHHVNVSMRQCHNEQQLSLVAERIESYDAVDAPSEECVKLVNDFCKLDLTCPVPGCGQQETRTLLLEGGLKLKDKDSKTDVYCFLFTDMLLVTKATAKRAGDKVKVIKPPMRLDKIIVCPLRDIASFMLLYLNEYHIAQAVYTMHGDSKMWLDGIKKAQLDYRQKRCEYLGRTDSIIFDNSADADDDIDYGPSTSGGVDEESSSTSLTTNSDPTAQSSIHDGFPTNNSDASLTGSTSVISSPRTPRLTGSRTTAMPEYHRTPPIHSTTPTSPRRTKPTDSVDAATSTSPLMRSDSLLGARHPRPRSAILMSQDEFMFSGVGGGSGGTDTDLPKSHDDADVQSQTIGDYLKVPSVPTSTAVWYRTEVAANVAAPSLSHCERDSSDLAAATASGLSSRSVRISKRPPLPTAINRTASSDASSALDGDRITSQVLPGADSSVSLTESSTRTFPPACRVSRRVYYGECEDQLSTSGVCRNSGGSVSASQGDSSNGDNVLRTAIRSSPSSNSSSSSSLLLENDSPVPQVFVTSSNLVAEVPTSLVPRFSLWPSQEGAPSSPDLVCAVTGEGHRPRLTSAERRKLSKELILTNPALEVSEV